MTDLNPASTFPARPVIFAGQAARPNWKKLADFEFGCFFRLTVGVKKANSL